MKKTSKLAAAISSSAPQTRTAARHAFYATISLSLVASSAALGACSSAQPNTPIPAVADIPGYAAAEPLTLAQYCDKLSALQTPWCDYYARCCPDVEDVLYTSLTACNKDYSTPTACVSYFENFIKVTGAVYAGAYAEAALAERAALIATAPTGTCSGTHYGELLTRFDGRSAQRQDGERALLQGQTADGEKCQYSLACKFGSTCTGTSGNFTCQKRGQSVCTFGDECSNGYECAGGRCMRASAGSRSCTLRADCKFGDVCTALGTCRSDYGRAAALCSSGEHCAIGFGCASAALSCIELKPTGAACAQDEACAAGRCKNQQCVGRCGGTGSY